ncbi:MAG: hypothetical protein IKE94_11280 [Aeriscardovia sp.]|nr:hypothetical protein [Aeriscardovia sp.]
MSELTPITRIENYLDAIVNSGTPPTEDITRIETFLQAIYDNTVCALTPITRIEMFLGKISGQDIVLPEPITRIELYLAAIAGEDVELPEEPITRLEMYLAEWADSGDWTTISGAIVEFITQRAHKLKSCVVSLSPKQDLSHGDPSPTNICPISGWTGCEVNVDGKNWFDKSNFTLLNNVYLENNTGEVKSGNGNKTLVIPAKEGEFTLSVSGLNISGRFGAFSDLPEVGDIPLSVVNVVSSVKKATLTAPSGTRYFAFTYNNTAVTQTYTEQEILDSIQIELGDTATDYEPYNGNAYSVTWEDEAGTVYGGTVDVVSGLLTLDRAYDVLDGSEVWGGSSSEWYTAKHDMMRMLDYSGMIISDKLKTVQCNSVSHADFHITGYVKNSSYEGHNWVYVKIDSNITTAAQLKEWLSNNPVHYVYPLAAPVEITITPTPITALKGYNAMWSNGGDITVAVKGTPVEVETLQALNMLLGGVYRNNQTSDDVSDEEALDIILGGKNR